MSEVPTVFNPNRMSKKPRKSRRVKSKQKTLTSDPKLLNRQNLRLRPRLGARTWPPRAHKFPTTFLSANEAVCVLKSLSVDLIPPYRNILENSLDLQRNKQSYWNCEQTETFDLSFYIPIQQFSSPNRKISTIIIMINGLNEVTNLHYTQYDRLGAALASKGIGAILHPSPFHLNRAAYMHGTFKNQWEKHHKADEELLQKWPDRESLGAHTTTRLPHHSMMRHPDALFNCFEQVSEEIIQTASFLKNISVMGRFDEDDVAFYLKFFEKKPRIALLGYSLGGLEALFSFLKSPDLFDYCIPLNSGAAINKLRTKPVRISDKDWTKIVQQTLSERNRLPNYMSREHQNILDEVLFNRPFVTKHAAETLYKNISKLLFIAGGADIVSPSEYVLQFIDKAEMASFYHGSETEGLNILQVGGLQHLVHNSPLYDQWFPLIINTIESFVGRPVYPLEQQVSYERILERLLQLTIAGKWLEEEVARRRWIDAEDHSIKMEKVLKELTENDRQEFKDLIIVSKRYFATDAELIRTMARERQERTKRDRG